MLLGRAELRSSIRDEVVARAPLHGPDFVALEVVSALARARRTGAITRRESEVLLEAYGALRIARHPSYPYRRRVLDLSLRLSAYDAAYVAVAEALEVPLLTTDARLAGAVTTVDVIHPS